MRIKKETSCLSVVRKIARTCKLLVKGKYPHFMAAFHLRIRVKFSNSLEGLILHKIMSDRSINLNIFADKFAVRSYVEEKIGTEYLPRMLGFTHDESCIPWNNLPEEFVIKSSHGSGGSVLVSKKADIKNTHNFDAKSWSKILLHPQNLDRFRIQKFFKILLKQNYSHYPGFFEYAYSQISPTIIIEELLCDDDGNIPSDYKFWCLNGKVEFIQVDTNRFGKHLRDFYDTEWNRISVTLTFPNSDFPSKAPNSLIDMIRIAEILSHGVLILRVDLYEINKRVIFGELTNYPGGGIEKFHPRTFSIEMASKVGADLLLP